ASRGAIARRIMVNHDNSVARKVDVELEAIGAGHQSAIERLNRVFRANLAPAAMRKHEGTQRTDRGIHRAILAGIESRHAIYLDRQDARRSAPGARAATRG